MEKQIIHGRMCVKRGKFWYAIRKPVTSRADYFAGLTQVRSNWPDRDTVHLGDNRLIVNQRS